MKDKKGFTLVELIVVIAILVVIAGLFSVNMIRTMNKNKKEEQQNVVTKIQSAAEIYVSANPEAVERLYNGYGYVDIEVGELRDAGLLSEDLKNAETGARVDDKEIVRVKFQVGEYLEYTYPVNSTDVANTEAYELVADPLYIEYKAGSSAESWCSSESNYFMGKFNGNGTQSPSDIASIPSKLYLMKERDGKIASLDNAELKKTSCNVNPSISGTYTITYSYKDIGLNVTKTKERTVYVGTSNNDVDRFTVAINNGNNIVINTSENSVPVTINEYYRNGSNIPNVIKTTVGDMKNVGYQIDKFSTATSGSFTALVKSIKANSDGSTPSQVEPPYVVTDALEVLVNVSNCTTSSTSGSTCYFRGDQDYNYVNYYDKIFRVYAVNRNNVKIIYDGNYTTAPYGQLGSCISGCCNNGRYAYIGLGDSTDGVSKVMDAYLDEFYNSLNSEDILKYLVNQTFNTFNNVQEYSSRTSGNYYNGFNYSDNIITEGIISKTLSKKVSLLTLSEYEEIAKCSSESSCSRNSNFLNGSAFWLLDLYGARFGVGAHNEGKNAAEVYHYSVDRSGYITHRGASKPDSSTTIDTDKLGVRPTLELKNAKVSHGSGTRTDPYIIKVR